MRHVTSTQERRDPPDAVMRQPITRADALEDLEGTCIALRFLDIESRRIALWHAAPRSGTGGAGLLFLHGVTYSSLSVFDLAVPGYDRHEFSALLRTAQADFHGFSIDLSGYGLSTSRDYAPQFADTCSEVSEAARQIRKLFALRSLTVVGWSYGAQLAARVVGTSKAADKCVFYGAFWGGGPTGRPVGGKVGVVPPGDRRRNTGTHAGADFRTPAHFDPNVKARFVERALQVDSTSPVAPLHHYAQGAPLFDPRLISCPILACYGSSDSSACDEDLDAMFATMPHRRAVRRCYDAADHNVHLGHQRQAFYESLFNFVDAC